EARLGKADKPPVKRDADLVYGFAFNLQRLDALGHYRNRLDVPPFGRDPYPLAVCNTQFLSQGVADFDELLGLQDGIELDVLGPVVEVLGKSIRGSDIGETACVSHGSQVVFEHASRRVGDGSLFVRVDRVIAKRVLEWFVVRGEGPLGHPLAREEPG